MSLLFTHTHTHTHTISLFLWPPAHYFEDRSHLKKTSQFDNSSSLYSTFDLKLLSHSLSLSLSLTHTLSLSIYLSLSFSFYHLSLSLLLSHYLTLSLIFSLKFPFNASIRSKLHAEFLLLFCLGSCRENFRPISFFPQKFHFQQKIGIGRSGKIESCDHAPEHWVLDESWMTETIMTESSIFDSRKTSVQKDFSPERLQPFSPVWMSPVCLNPGWLSNSLYCKTQQLCLLKVAYSKEFMIQINFQSKPINWIKMPLSVS